MSKSIPPHTTPGLQESQQRATWQQQQRSVLLTTGTQRSRATTMRALFRTQSENSTHPLTRAQLKDILDEALQIAKALDPSPNATEKNGKGAAPKPSPSSLPPQRR